MSKADLLIKFVNLVPEGSSTTYSSTDLCDTVEEEGNCFGVNCEDCPLAGAINLKEAVEELIGRNNDKPNQSSRNP